MSALTESLVKGNSKVFRNESQAAARAYPEGGSYLSDQCAVCSDKSNETYATVDCMLTTETRKLYLLPEYRNMHKRLNEACKPRKSFRNLGKPRGCPNCCVCPRCQSRVITFAAKLTEDLMSTEDENDDGNNEGIGYWSDGGDGGDAEAEAGVGVGVGGSGSGGTGLDGSGGACSPKRLRVHDEVRLLSCVQGKGDFFACRKN